MYFLHLQISHTFQIAYAYHPETMVIDGMHDRGEIGSGGGGETAGLAVGRTKADKFRVLIERELPLALGMVPRAVKVTDLSLIDR